MRATFNIDYPDNSLRERAIEKIDNLNKPKGSLGLLEDIALQICLVQQTLSPELRKPTHLLFGGDHGIEREGVSISPRDITWQQMINFTHGGGGVNMFCRQHGFDLKIIDIGVDYDLSAFPQIIDRKIARGTQNFLQGPAMSWEEYDKAINVGKELTAQAADEGCNILCIGEMGIANTSPSSIWMSILGGLALDDCIGAGAGLNSDGVEHKRQILNKALYKFLSEKNSLDTENIIRYFGGFEMVGAIGAILAAAERKMLVLIDGFIISACALAAWKLYPASKEYMIFGHCGDESGHRNLLNLMDAKPLLNLGLRLGEGTGALCAYPIVDSAVRMINQMNNFQNANITKYF